MNGKSSGSGFGATDGLILLASDHAGLDAKRRVAALLESRRLPFRDLGARSSDPVDYPDFAHELARGISAGFATRGILICGSGIGMSIAANRHTNVRAALCHSEEYARLARQHNDANVLVLGGRYVGPVKLRRIVTAWLETSFEGGRHARRVAKIEALRQTQS